MKVVITGSKGFVGSHLVEQCRDRGMSVVEADLPDTDICTEDVSEFIPRDADAIIHLAALSRDADCTNKAYDTFRLNVMGTLNLMEAAEKQAARQFIFASSEWVYDNCSDQETKTEDSLINIANHTSEYALSKLVSEANLRQKYARGFCPVTILRFGIIYGSRQTGGSAVESLFQAVKLRDCVEVGSLRTGRHFIHVSDIVAGIIKSIGLPGFEIINLEGDKLITLRDIIETSKILLGRNPEVIEKNPANVSIRRISNEKAKKLLGWAPGLDLEKGLKLQ
jgi:UDP-glucose 4-epimerase